MPDNIRIVVDTRRVQEAFQRAPAAMVKSIRRYLSRSAHEVAREARERAPKAFSTLTLAILAKLDPAPTLSARVTAGTQYARHVEEGTGPGGVPPREALRAWLRVKRIEPRNPNMTEDALIWLIQRKIAARGTAPQPYMEPALEAKRSRVFDLIELGVEKGIAEAFA